ncbi:hypothetical protein [Salarchaeum japonicum]|uniref:hypothetical protein n=1 Tax=Salarchaeum japonicum TaxID=555573 RepID=UPI001D09FA81|nr:hypothetical protein [Salarchaeum japonicum]
MSVQAAASVSIYDFFTRIIPGSVLVAPGIISLSAFEPDLFNNITVVIISAALLCFLAGELMNLLREILFRVPWTFRRFLARITDDDRHLTSLQRVLRRVEMVIRDFGSTIRRKIGVPKEQSSRPRDLEKRLSFGFKESIKEELSVDFTTFSTYDIYDLLVLELEPEFRRSTRRARLMHEFTMNLKIAAGSGVLIYSAFYLPEGRNLVLRYAVAFSLGLLALSWLISRISESSSNIYTEALLKQYYQKFR